jgi:glycosyltransferase involved in cell wall biosynthesis
MRKLYHMGLESYSSRYTYQLTDWTERVFKRRGIDYVVVPGLTLDNSQKISVGQVLDAHGRSYFAMSQMMNLVRLMQQGEVTGEDVVFFEDMFSPGIESLPYIMDQIPEKDRPRVFVRCLAQTIDPDDFVHVWNMEKWMGYYERMIGEFATVLASNEEMVAHSRIAGWTAPIYNISGLAFSIEEVLERVDNKVKPFHLRSNRVVFSSRWDREKQPDFFMDIVDELSYLHPYIEFALLQGGPLRSNDPLAVERARKLELSRNFKIYENLSKNEYYALLNDSRVLVNTALQDWTSNTVSEADTLGCNVLFPAYRSFPEVFANDHERMYVPWSKDDAITKLKALLDQPHKNMGKISKWTDGTIDRCIDIMEGKGEIWNRSHNNYRRWVSEAKYR